MQKRIINLIDSVDAINIGIWSSVIVNSSLLPTASVRSELYFPEARFEDKTVNAIQLSETSIKKLHEVIRNENLNADTDLIITHGLWHYPSRWGYNLKKMGFKWIYVPHGMLEPWPLQQKWLKKKVYFNLIERRLAKHADLIRAVSKPEAKNLARLFPGKRIEFIPNGVKVDKNLPPIDISSRQDCTRYLFLSRLHHKKNILALCEAWVASSLNNKPDFEFIIAGPDQGELEKLQTIIASSGNIKYLGGVFGPEKEALFQRCIFYILPSFSEGLPSALLEAMANGLIPIITEGCNFPDVFENDLGVKVTTDKNSIKEALEQSSSWTNDTIQDKSQRGRALIVDQYSLEAVTEKQMEIYFGAKLLS